MKSLGLKIETVRVLTARELETVDGGWFKRFKKLFKVDSVKVQTTDGPGESFDLGYRGPIRKPWVWDGVNRVWRTD